MAYTLWTRVTVKELIKQEFSIKIAIRTVGKYLWLWGFTPQKSLKKAYEQNPKKVTQLVGGYLSRDQVACQGREG